MRNNFDAFNKKKKRKSKSGKYLIIYKTILSLCAFLIHVRMFFFRITFARLQKDSPDIDYEVRTWEEVPRFIYLIL